jgi:hypothetical protein
VSTIDPSNPAHVEAVRWACATWIAVHPGTVSEWPSLWHHAAMRVIIDPALSASLLRALLERGGVDVHVHNFGQECDDGNDSCAADVLLYTHALRPNALVADIGLGDANVERRLSADSVPRLILALLDISADAPDRRERAMAALKERGR